MRIFVSKKELAKLVAAEVAEAHRIQRVVQDNDAARQEAVDKEVKFNAHIKELIADFTDFRDVGGTFRYFGIRFVVVSISSRLGAYIFGVFKPGTAFITCEYIAPNGKITRRNFDYIMLAVLKAENSR